MRSAALTLAAGAGGQRCVLHGLGAPLVAVHFDKLPLYLGKHPAKEGTALASSHTGNKEPSLVASHEVLDEVLSSPCSGTLQRCRPA